MNNAAAILTAAGGLLVALGGLYKIWRDAHNASAAEAAKATAQIITDLRNEMTTLRDEVHAQRDELRVQRRQINLVVTDRDDLARYLHQVMRWIRGGAAPPAPPIPAHLRDAFQAAGVPWPGEEPEHRPTSLSDVQPPGD